MTEKLDQSGREGGKECVSLTVAGGGAVKGAASLEARRFIWMKPGASTGDSSVHERLSESSEV